MYISFKIEGIVITKHILLVTSVIIFLLRLNKLCTAHGRVDQSAAASQENIPLLSIVSSHPALPGQKSPFRGP